MRQNIGALTGIRGVAALWVVLHHALIAYPFLSVFSFIHNFLQKGWLGVDLFFILSGFVISYVHQEDFSTLPSYKVKTFLLLRLSRIYPAHLTTLLSLIPIVYLAQVTFHYHSTIDQFSVSQFFYSLFLLNGWGFNASDGWNIPSWSVSSEWFAYLCFPFIAFFLCRLKTAKSYFVLIVLVYLVLFLLAIVLNDANKFMLSWHLILIRVSSEFLIGCCLFNLNRLSEPSDTKDSMVLISLFVMGILCILSIAPILDGVIIMTFTVLIYGLSKAGPITTKLFANRTMLYLGKISYSIYLTHYIVLMIFNQLTKKAFEQPGLTLQVFIFILYISLTILLSHLLFYFIEDPIRDKVKRKLNQVMSDS
jgi:peptidoglycan/LPS O-acetylase OafA/YrhL